MTEQIEAGKVTQADRDAAADLYLDQLGDEDGFAERIRAGTNLPGCNAWEEAFAAHRIAGEQAGRIAGLEEAAGACEAEHLEEPQCHQDAAYDHAINHCVAAIRALKGPLYTVVKRVYGAQLSSGSSLMPTWNNPSILTVLTQGMTNWFGSAKL